MKRINLLIISAVILGIAITGCKKDTSSSSSTPGMGLSIQALNTRFNLPVTSTTLKAATATSVVQITSAKLLVSKFSFDAELKSSNKAHDSISIEYNWTGPKLIDLLKDSADFGRLTLQAGFYDEIELKVNSVRNNNDSVPVFSLMANFTDSANVVVPISLKVFEPMSIATELKNDTITSTSTSAFSGAVQIYLDQLFVGITPAQLHSAVKTNGTIVISTTSNASLYRILTANFIKRHHGEYRRRHW
jgi:hypothetical protein